MSNLIEEIQEQARIEGFETGAKFGFAEGNEVGLEVGQTEGFENGTKYGYERGYADAEVKYQNIIEALLIEQFKL